MYSRSPGSPSEKMHGAARELRGLQRLRQRLRRVGLHTLEDPRADQNLVHCTAPRPPPARPQPDHRRASLWVHPRCVVHRSHTSAERRTTGRRTGSRSGQDDTLLRRAGRRPRVVRCRSRNISSARPCPTGTARAPRPGGAARGAPRARPAARSDSRSRDSTRSIPRAKNITRSGTRTDSQAVIAVDDPAPRRRARYRGPHGGMPICIRDPGRPATAHSAEAARHPAPCPPPNGRIASSGGRGGTRAGCRWPHVPSRV